MYKTVRQQKYEKEKEVLKNHVRELTDRNNVIFNDKEKEVEYRNNREQIIANDTRISELHKYTEKNLCATSAYCDVTNAIISKCKSLVDDGQPEVAFYIASNIERLCIEEGLLTVKDLERQL